MTDTLEVKQKLEKIDSRKDSMWQNEKCALLEIHQTKNCHPSLNEMKKWLSAQGSLLHSAIQLVNKKS